ncbi:hypothetical protein Hdeb2414_s0586g00920121 [Helianthus debilis subsp. tardiflorus]
MKQHHHSPLSLDYINKHGENPHLHKQNSTSHPSLNSPSFSLGFGNRSRLPAPLLLRQASYTPHQPATALFCDLCDIRRHHHHRLVVAR